MNQQRSSVLKQMVGLLRPYRPMLLGPVAALAALAYLNLAMPKVTGYVLDNVFKGKGDVLSAAARFSLLLKVLVVILVIYVARNILFYFQKKRFTVAGERIAFELRRRLIAHLHTLSVDFYQKNKPGKISARVMQDVQSVKQFVQDELGSITINLLMLVVAAAIMLSVSWPLALVTLGVLPFHVLTYYLFRAPITRYARQAKESIADVGGDLLEQFDGAATVQASATQLIEQEKFSDSMRRSMRAQIKQTKYYTLQKVAADLLVGAGLIVLFLVGGHLVLNETISAGQFVEFYGYVWLLYPRLIELVGQGGKFPRTSTSVTRVFEILSIEPDVQEDAKAVPVMITKGKIEFRNVSFGYQNGTVLHDVTFTVEPGQHVLVTGPSGSGKSTCVNLIPRFYDPSAGSILVDGIDLRDFTLTSLRRQIGFVFQDCFLFNDTIMANIRYAWPEAGDEAVVAAAIRAYANDFIERLPNGYATMIGEGGVQLSQGEKRRLMIARAILKAPRILILDEPLVSLDRTARERAIEGLASLMRDRTVLTITHYPAELPYAHKQVHISDGRVTVRDLSGQVLSK